MKCEIIRDDLEVAPAFIDRVPPEIVETRQEWRNGQYEMVTFFKKGALLEEKHAFRLVQQGCAVPADDACRQRARRTPQQMKEAQRAYERLHRGIHPDDFDLYDKGYIVGYEPDGSYKPGPKWDEYQALLAAEAAEELEDEE